MVLSDASAPAAVLILNRNTMKIEKGYRRADYSAGKSQKMADRAYDSLILHIPHSGTEFPGIDKGISRQLVDNARDVIDWFTDELFSSEVQDERIIPVIFPYCRTFCDVERMIEDPLKEENLGICYESDPLGPCYGFFKAGTENVRINRKESYRLYQEHHHRTEDLLLCAGRTLLIDCHSFSSYPTPILPHYDKNEEVDICIGYNEDRTRPWGMAIDTVINHFRSLGYVVGVNTPFSNAKTFNTPVKYDSLMIELNKKLYMDERSGQKKPTFGKLKSEINSLYVKLLGYMATITFVKYSPLTKR